MISDQRKKILLQALDRNAEEYLFAIDERPDLDPRVIRFLMTMETLDIVCGLIEDLMEAMP